MPTKYSRRYGGRVINAHKTFKRVSKRERMQKWIERPDTLTTQRTHQTLTIGASALDDSIDHYSLIGALDYADVAEGDGPRAWVESVSINLEIYSRAVGDPDITTFWPYLMVATGDDFVEYLDNLPSNSWNVSQSNFAQAGARMVRNGNAKTAIRQDTDTGGGDHVKLTWKLGLKGLKLQRYENLYLAIWNEHQVAGSPTYLATFSGTVRFLSNNGMAG